MADSELAGEVATLQLALGSHTSHHPVAMCSLHAGTAGSLPAPQRGFYPSQAISQILQYHPRSRLGTPGVTYPLPALSPLQQFLSSRHTNPTGFTRSSIPLGRGCFQGHFQGSSKTKAPYAAPSTKGRGDWERPGEASAGTRDLHIVMRDVEAGPSCSKPATPWAIEGHSAGCQLIETKPQLILSRTALYALLSRKQKGLSKTSYNSIITSLAGTCCHSAEGAPCWLSKVWMSLRLCKNH